MTKLGLPTITILAALGQPFAALAQDWPARPVSIVVVNGPGTPSEVEARRLGQYLETVWKRPIVIDNRPGAGGLIGSEYVTKAAPDGYTVLWGTATLATYKVLNKDTRFEPLKDFEPVSLILNFPGGFITSSQVPARNIDEFIAYVKANPGKLNYGSGGRNTTMLVVEALLYATGTRMTWISYQSSVQATTAMMRNDVQLANVALNGALKAQIDGGAPLRPLMIIGSRRSRVFPEVATSAEKGWNIPNNGWSGLLVPAGTPRPIVNRIAADVAAYVALPEVQKRGLESGIDMLSSTPEQFRQLMENDVKVWGDVANAIGLKPE